MKWGGKVLFLKNQSKCFCKYSVKGASKLILAPTTLAQLVKNLPEMQDIWVRSLGWEDPLEKGKAIHSSIQAWRIPRAVQSIGSQRVGHDWVTFTFTFQQLWEENLRLEGKE